jgi:cellulose synthase/poly-beta-1,6-N-acetylglucosamine synthase-like glycosyltransferase
MISIIITSFREPKTIGRAIKSIVDQEIKEDYELIVSSPDEETQNIVNSYAEKYWRIKLFKDPGKGKTLALNMILPTLKGDIIVLTDGDVFVSRNSINEILKLFEDKRIGCVGGRPVPVEDKSTKWGFFANFLFDSAHEMRFKLWENKEFLEVSGYLWAFRNGIIKEIPVDTAEDSIVPLMFNEKGYTIGYSANAQVYVKNVDNFNDWIKQKVRTSKAHEVLDKYFPNRPVMKGFSQEAKGALKLFSYPKSLKQFYWFIQLIFMRGYMWYKAKKGEKYRDGWQAVGSTK